MKAMQQRPVPLPADVEGFTKRLGEKKTVVRDNIMLLMTALYRDDAEFQQLLEAVEDDEAIHGSFQFDRCFAAAKIKQRASEESNIYVAKLTEAVIARHIESCMVTLGHGRKQRRQGEKVPVAADDDDASETVVEAAAETGDESYRPNNANNGHQDHAPT